MSSPQYKQRLIATRERRLKIRKLMLSGITNVRDLAIRFGVSQTQIIQDMKWVRKQWAIEDARLFRNDSDRRLMRIQMLMDVITKAADSFERSKQNAEKVTTHTKKAVCSECRGQGKVKSKGSSKAVKCTECKGAGNIDITVETREIKGQAGDSSFLKVVRDCITEINKMEGLQVVNHKVQGSIEHDHQHQHVHAHLVVPVQELNLPLSTRKTILNAIRARADKEAVDTAVPVRRRLAGPRDTMNNYEEGEESDDE